MASDAQINANRANSQLSTGPKTDAGKSRSSQNAVKHGFYTKAYIVQEGEQDDFTDLVDGLFAELRPGPHFLLRDTFAHIVHCCWNLHRLRIAEARTYATSPDPFSDAATIRKLEFIARQMARFERSKQAAMKQYANHATNIENFNCVPHFWRDTIPTVVKVHSFHKAHREVLHIFDFKDLVPPENRPDYNDSSGADGQDEQQAA